MIAAYDKSAAGATLVGPLPGSKLCSMANTLPAAASAPALDACLPRARALLERWAEAMEPWWTPIADGAGLFGLGAGQWGVQAAWRHCAACAVLAQEGSLGATHWRARALDGLRQLIATHLTGTRDLPMGGRWGRNWISVLALERTWHGVRLLESELTANERAAFDRLLADEALWLCDSYQRGNRRDLVSTRWARDGGNNGESNIWNGCFLWRIAERLPEHPRNADWRERAHAFMLNGVCVAADATDDRLFAGKPLRDWHQGAGFFDHFSFDHHSYLNVGYQVICLSHAAILHFDAKLEGFSAPESVHLHQADLWDVVRRTVFADGRLARIGGDSRVRYAYCQEYLVPSALYAADHLGDSHALALIEGWLTTAEQEAAFSGDGSFYRRRLDHLATTSPTYWLRLESDRACALSMLLQYQPLVRAAPAVGDAETRLAGGWSEPEHGAVLHRSPSRLAAFAWHAHDLVQGTCQPPDDGHLAEWSNNLVGNVTFADLKPAEQRGKLISHDQQDFAGGFLTWGRLARGCGCQLDEGWKAPVDGQAVHHLAVAALPDDRSLLTIEVVRIGARPAIVRAGAALHLNLPNDCFNGGERVVTTANGERTLRCGEHDGVVPLDSRWAQLAPRLGVIGLSGGSTLAVDRSRERRGGPYRSLHVEAIVWGAWQATRCVAPGSDVLDAAWLVRSGGDAADTARCAEANPHAARALGPEVRAVDLTLPDGRVWTLVLNLAAEAMNVAGFHERCVHAGPATIAADGTLALAGQAATLLARPR